MVPRALGAVRDVRSAACCAAPVAPSLRTLTPLRMLLPLPAPRVLLLLPAPRRYEARRLALRNGFLYTLSFTLVFILYSVGILVWTDLATHMEDSTKTKSARAVFAGLIVIRGLVNAGVWLGTHDGLLSVRCALAAWPRARTHVHMRSASSALARGRPRGRRKRRRTATMRCRS